MKERALTHKQKTFADNVVAGMTLSDAYRGAYSTSNQKIASINRNACAVMAIDKVASRVHQLQVRNEQQEIASTLSDRQLVLKTLRADVLNKENATARLRAAELLGKTIGMYKEVVETQQDTRSPKEIRVELEKRLDALLGPAEGEPTH